MNRHFVFPLLIFLIFCSCKSRDSSRVVEKTNFIIDLQPFDGITVDVTQYVFTELKKIVHTDFCKVLNSGTNATFLKPVQSTNCNYSSYLDKKRPYFKIATRSFFSFTIIRFLLLSSLLKVKTRSNNEWANSFSFCFTTVGFLVEMT